VGADDVSFRRVAIVNFGRCSDHGDFVGRAVDFVREYVIKGGDEEFWGFSFGSHVEHAGDGHYYVARDPDEEDYEDDEEPEAQYEHCEALPTLACVVHSFGAALEEASKQGDSKPYSIKP
jgi:hypothetical protein